MSILDTIISAKKQRILYAKRRTALPDLRSEVRDAEGARDFMGSLRGKDGHIRLIAEIKKASPSAGVIRPDFDPAAIARVYQEKPADCISVLTEEDFFQGDLLHLRQVKAASAKPVLRKDFIVDEYQIYESRAAGADAILLIASVLTPVQASDYLGLAAELGMAVLFEIHDEPDLERSLVIGSKLTGINNRDLTTFAVDLSTTIRLSREIPEGTIVVSESGISDRRDVETLIEAGIDAMLVGTSFMKARDIGAAIDALMSPS